MNMVTKIAFANMKYHKSRNILTGIAVFLTTLLLFLVPTIGLDMILAEFEIVNEVYPTWHAAYQDVDEKTAQSIVLHQGISRSGLRCDVGSVAIDEKWGRECRLQLFYFDENAADMCKERLISGRMPQKENEIVLSGAALVLLNQSGRVGDTVTIPVQIARDGGLDYAEEKEFVICGMTNEGMPEKGETASYWALVSEDFMKEELADELRYSVLVQIGARENVTSDAIERTIFAIAEQFGIPERNVNLNSSYLNANYVDPAAAGIIAAVMAVIILAGIITIYGIYYVSMGQKIREFGRLSALGATKRQLRQIVLREGLWMAVFAVPAGLAAGALLVKPLLLLLARIAQPGENVPAVMYREIIEGHRIALLHGELALGAAAIAFFTAWVSLLKPMKIVQKAAEAEAMRGAGQTIRRKRRPIRGNVARHLAANQIFSNKKRSLLIICSMGMTGILIMMMASLFASASPEQRTDEECAGEYEISVYTEEGNKEHPEYAWSAIQQDNPLTDELRGQIEALDGVTSVDAVSFYYVDIDGIEETEEGNMAICGVPESYLAELEDTLIEGEFSYEELKSGDAVIVTLLDTYWYPQLQNKSSIKAVLHDGEQTVQKEFKIAAVCDSQRQMFYGCLIMEKEAADRLCRSLSDRYLIVNAKKDYDEELDRQIRELAHSSRLLSVTSRQENLEYNRRMFSLIAGACYVLLGVLSLICIMNLINVMLNSVYARRKELAMLQAVGMTDRQLQRMLLREGLFYTAGTLVLALGAGSLLGYGVFLVAKEEMILSIRTFSYPFPAAAVMIAVLVLVQVFLSVLLSRSVKEESLIERIRFSE